MFSTDVSNNFSFLNKSSSEIAREFEQIPNATIYGEKPDPILFATALIPANNLSKNRYRDILPNEPTRVKLEGKLNDYINANYCLRGRVILAQGPLKDMERYYPNHHFDFFHMLWTNKCSAIAMVTDYVEKGAVKCSRYLPEDDYTPKRLQDYTVSTLTDDPTDGIPFDLSSEVIALNEVGIRTTTVYLEKEDQGLRALTHYHYPVWGDDKGTDGKVVAALARTLLKESTPVIHCSAGVGRSGTVAAVMDAYLRIQSGQFSDSLIFDVVSDLRNERRGCVQSAEQYQTIYDAVNVLLQEDMLTQQA